MKYDWGTSPWLSAFKPFLDPEGFEAVGGVCYMYIRIVLLYVSSPIFIVAELMLYFN